jgi:hypothetical protein
MPSRLSSMPYGATVVIMIESYFKSCRSDPLWKSPTQTGGRCDPATNDQCVKLVPLGLTGAVAPRENSPSVG